MQKKLPEIMDQARGKWPGALSRLGISASFLNGKHHPCPKCGGKDRFRFLNSGENGTYICNQCGNGNGLGLLMKVKGWDFKTAAAEVRGVLHLVQPSTSAKPARSASAHIVQSLWMESAPLPGTQGDAYLADRGLSNVKTDALRFHPHCPLTDVPGHKFAPAVIALATDKDGNPCGITRTYLDGVSKADWRDIDGKQMSQRRFLGDFPKGCAVRLFEPRGGELAGGEGFETSIAYARLKQIATWALLNTSIMESWIAPTGTKHLRLAADNDLLFGGQKAAYTAAHENALRDRYMEVDVDVPPHTGDDWLNVLQATLRCH